MTHKIHFLSLLVAALLLMTQETSAKCTNYPYYISHLPGVESNIVQWDEAESTIYFKVFIYSWDGCGGGFKNFSVQLCKDGSNYIEVMSGSTNYDGGYNILTSSFGKNEDVKDVAFSCPVGSGVYSTYVQDFERRVAVTITLDKQWRNSEIKVKATGTWKHYNSDSSAESYKENNSVISTPYNHQVRQINWDGNYSISSDGTVTIPYAFENTSRNTDKETHICTSIDGFYNDAIGLKSPDPNYANGSYSFKLSDIGKNMLSEFTLEPYHEFTHHNDIDAGNTVKNYATYAGPKTFLPLPVATIKNAEFNQVKNQVELSWTASNKNYGNGKWVIYRNNRKVGVVNQYRYVDIYMGGVYIFNRELSDINTFTDRVDTDFPYESDVTYTVFYIMDGWDENAKADILKSNEFTVNTTRRIPLKEFNAGSRTDRIALTWKTDKLPADWGHRFYIYVDNETMPVDTVFPADGQTSFRWEHRSTDQHTDRKNGMDGTTPYIEEPLTALSPHIYKVVGAVGNVALDSVITDKISIGAGTLFYSIEASKNTYAGQVQLNWHVNRQGSDIEQTYTIYRRRAEKQTDVWTKLGEIPSTKDHVSYTDNTPLPGVCYEYRVHIEEKRSDGKIFTNDTTDIGFAQASATISGRITFGTSGMAVQGVEVEAKQIDEDNNRDQYHAIRITGENGQLIWNYPSENYAAGIFSTQPWSIQMWLNPDELKEQTILLINGTECYVGMRTDGSLMLVNGSDTYTFSDAPLIAKSYNHVTLARSGNTITCYVLADSIQPTVRQSSSTLKTSLSVSTADILAIGGFKGYVDEFRLWTKCLTEKEIKDNYDHLLVGSEKNLETYWPFDEGLNTQFFDYARDGTDYREHHGRMDVNTQSSSYAPDRLALRARTDSVGNYIIRGVPFSGEGTTYAIVPMLGIHTFNPTQQLRYVSTNSLVHNGTDFDDVSSFPVSGTVYYAGTNYPVEGCNFYVDGQICAKDGELIETNAYGQYTISVPIGEHFIQIKKQGHEFINDGRYPAKAGTYINFDREIKNLTFYDSTLVNFTGRIAGGDIEGNKPVGFGQSQNNIGVATLTLTPRGIGNTNYYINAFLPTEGTVIQYQPNTAKVSVASASPNTIHSVAWRGFGSADECQKFYICTDSLTGEFSAMLPPLDYLVTRVYVKSADLELVGNTNEIAVDMTNPQITSKDSVLGADSTMRYYEYHTLLRQTYHSQPTFNVTQENHTDGSFGIDEYIIQDEYGVLKINDIHHLKADTVEYTFGYPLFVKEDSYTFHIEGYEEYVNKDVEENIVTRVPLSGIEVTIDNALSDGKVIYTEDNTVGAEFGSIAELQSNQLKLDSLGEASYTWKAGFPNITGSHTCDLNMSYAINGRTYQWRTTALRGIVLGDIPTGNNFVTKGPNLLLMVLRDPPGSQSYATWEKGTTTRNVTVRKSEDGYIDNKEIVKIATGVEMTSGVGIGTMLLSSVETVLEWTAGYHMTIYHKKGTSCDIAITADRAISTSNSPEYDGAEGDVFFGTGTNLLFGKCINIGLYRNPNDTSKAVIDMQEATLTGVEFNTTFAYTQHYIEHDLIPNLEMIRNSQVKEDSVAYYDAQIHSWKEQLAINEKDKVDADSERAKMEQDGILTNYSFDAGSSITNTYRNDSTTGKSRDFEQTYHGILGFEGGHYINELLGFGVQTINEFGAEDGQNASSETHKDTTTTTVTTFSYTLKDTDPTDAITVDVYQNYGRFGSPLFRTRGGQTSNKYEGEVKTKYHEPGTTIMDATMQVEKPQIEAEPRTVSNVPSGSAANFALKLRNISDIKTDITYKLSLLESSNLHGAQLIMDGMPLTGDGRAVHIPYGEITKSLQLLQSDLSILDYQKIGIILSSQHQSSIADTVYITAQFVPSSSPVSLAVNTNTINTHTDTVLVLTMKDFDRNFYHLKAFRIQYKQQGGNWTDLHEYVLDGSHLASNQQMLPDSMNIIYRLSMKNAMSWPDATYTFRIVSVSTYGIDEVYVYSNEETVIKDTSYPRPLGLAQPTDGILDIGDELSITYNMPFISGALSPENFLITGVLNGTKVEHHTALHTYKDTVHATARTEANINLSGKDFSLDAWLYIQSEGILLSHGVDKQRMTIATNEQGQMVITFADSVYTSIATVPRNKWIFFTLSRKVSSGNGQMNVTIAYDETKLPLFTDKTVPLYYGNGPITVGGGAIAAVHELLLWDKARDIATAWQESSVTKSPSTRHLIGYWKMNEGEGTSIRDYARNRHMVMPEESWYLNNINKAVTLNGSQYVAVCTANVPPLPQDDYAMEMWFQGGTQADTAQLMQLGDISLWLDPNGQPHLQSGTNQWAMTDHQSSLTNNGWHHIMLNVRRYGTAAVYVDGERALTVSASAIGSFAADSLFVGVRKYRDIETDSTAAYYHHDRYFTGAIDEIRLWKTTIASDMLASKRKMRLNGDEPGLLLYYPFEKKRLDENTQIVTEGSFEELSINEKGNHNGTSATINGQMVNEQMVNFTDNAPALKEKPTQTNVAFSFTASDTKIVIDIDELPATVDGCTLNFTVKDVRSVNGNPSLPATWTAFVHRNELAWQDDELTIVKEVDDTFTITTAIINRSGTPQRWYLSELPTSLTASSTSGMLNPLEKATITFYCHETAPLGKHERTIYAMGNNGVPTPLTLHVSVTGEIPDWSVNPADYETSMNVISQLDFFGHISDDEDDIIAAFINDTCRGVTKSDYKERYDGYYQTLTIYGRPEDQGKTVTFRAYRASTGVYYTLVTPDKTIKYNPLSIVGRYDEPILLSVKDQIVQRTTLKQGWNWVSFFTQADDMHAQTVFADIADDVIAVKGHTADIGYLLRTDTGWVGTMTEKLLNRRSYRVKMKNERELVLIGKGINPATNTVRIHIGWGWPGYYGLHRIPLVNALAGADPQNGDIVRTQSAAAYFDTYEWVGSLQALEPGQGYVYYSVTDEEKWFAYPSSSVAAAPRRNAKMVNDIYTGRFAPDNEYGYPYNMILVGQVLLDKQPAANAEIAIFDGDECRSVGYTDAEGRLLMLVAGEDEATLSYRLVINDQVFETVETLHYLTDDIVGTPDAPHLICFGEGQGIDSVTNDPLPITNKIIIDNQLFILRNGKTYNATGQEAR